MPLLAARRLCKAFPAPGGGVRVAVDGVSLELFAGETLALVGESGCGKTTLARLLTRLMKPDAGEIFFEGKNLLSARGRELRALRREMQMVFQDPFASLNPRQRVASIVGEPLAIHDVAQPFLAVTGEHASQNARVALRLTREARRQRALETLRAVGLDAAALPRYPHEFSGGQRQRIGIARALILRPKLIVADEPVSALDVSVGAQILELLQRLQREFHLTYLLISHSLPVLAQLATRIAVMRDGRIVELGPAPQVLGAPAHPYTKELLAAVPVLPA